MWYFKIQTRKYWLIRQKGVFCDARFNIGQTLLLFTFGWGSRSQFFLFKSSNCSSLFLASRCSDNSFLGVFNKIRVS